MVMIENARDRQNYDFSMAVSQITAEITDKRIGATDKDIFACSVEDSAINLVTLDNDMIGNKELEKSGVKIKYPMDLIIVCNQ